jgi:hypothetical protein
MSGRYSPADVAAWLERFAKTAEEHIREARVKASKPSDPAFRRVEIDTLLQAGLGQFFAEKLRAGIAYTLYQKKGHVGALHDAVRHYRAAREAWAGIVKRTKGVYVDDLAFGYPPHRRGHWADRLPAIEQDLAFMERLLNGRNGSPTDETAAALLKPRPPVPLCRHVVPQSFVPGRPLEIEIASPPGSVERMRIHYRHVNQAEAYHVEEMAAKGDLWRFRIPAMYTDTAFPLLYYFELRGRKGNAWIYPGLNAEVSNQPYFVVRRSSA